MVEILHNYLTSLRYGHFWLLPSFATKNYASVSYLISKTLGQRICAF